MTDDQPDPGQPDRDELAPEDRRRIREYLTGPLGDEIASTLPTFMGADTTAPSVRRCLEQFIATAIRFARLERLFQGDVIFSLPAQQIVLDRELSGEPAADGAMVAEHQRDLWQLDLAPVENLSEILDSQGIKVISKPGPFAAVGSMFSSETGPAILLTQPADSPEGRAALSHAYGHLVIDIDPYRNRFCPLGTGVRGSAEEIRAEAFAAALLLPRTALPLDAEPDGPEVERLSAAYQLPREVARQRILELTDPDATHVESRDIPVDADWTPPL
ncbi:MAG: ImmA/IrrE family metallo-endopeptidase, partial [Candidatus Eisenbacteria bacterium]|nr:ImmA/IrrE family metallo-endopeptidase [Candidatus Eisenbacteria bacterium]